MMKKEKAFVVLFLIGILLASPGFGQKPCGPAPKAERHRIKAGEGFPPLPLPVTPLRRTEKKRPPAPPVLMGKINYGEPMIGVRSDGSSYKYWIYLIFCIKKIIQYLNIQILEALSNKYFNTKIEFHPSLGMT